jgi:hypothetical protein
MGDRVKEGRPVLPLFVAKYEINPAVEILAHLLALYTQKKQILNKKIIINPHSFLNFLKSFANIQKFRYKCDILISDRFLLVIHKKLASLLY